MMQLTWPYQDVFPWFCHLYWEKEGRKSVAEKKWIFVGETNVSWIFLTQTHVAWALQTHIGQICLIWTHATGISLVNPCHEGINLAHTTKAKLGPSHKSISFNLANPVSAVILQCFWSFADSELQRHNGWKERRLPSGQLCRDRSGRGFCF